MEVWLFLFGQKLASLIRAFLSAADTGSFHLPRGRSGCGNQTNPRGNTCFHGCEITVKAAQRPATGTVHRFLRALRDVWGVLRVFPRLSRVRARSSSAGRSPGTCCPRCHCWGHSWGGARSLVLPPSTNTGQFPFGETGGDIVQRFARSVVVQAETEVKQLSAFLDLLACSVQQLACIDSDS